jgi:SAM-dependent methyltransferase
MLGPHELQAPSPWVVRWAALIRPGGAVLDVASGHGRHARHLAAQGYRVTAVDRDPAALASVAGLAGVRAVEADLEGAPWPFEAGTFDGVVVANYLHRPLFDALAATLAPGGLLVYETFMQGNERYGKPSNPDFLLRPYELADAWRGRLERPKPAVVQRVCALRPPADVTIGESGCGER